MLAISYLVEIIILCFAGVLVGFVGARQNLGMLRTLCTGYVVGCLLCVICGIVRKGLGIH